MDPFCGSGTTLLEAARRGYRVIGFDCNPIAVLISSLKVMPTDDAFLDLAQNELALFERARPRLMGQEHALPDFPGRDHWFGAAQQRELAAIRKWVFARRDARVKLWLKVALSAIVNRVSYQDSETRYARVQRDSIPGNVFSLFSRQAASGLRQLRSRGSLAGGDDHLVQVANVRDGIPLADGSVDVVITSPPYANTMDYYLYHKQRMNVLGYDYKVAQRAEIGSRHEYSSQKAGTEKWRADYTEVLREIGRVLRPEGKGILVIGDSQIAGELIDSASLTLAASDAAGLTARLLGSSPLAQRSRSFNWTFQRPNKQEHTFELRKA